MLRLQIAQPVHQLRAARGGVLDQLLVPQHVDRGGGGGRGDGAAAAVGAAVGTRCPAIHQVGPGGDAGDRQAAA